MFLSRSVIFVSISCLIEWFEFSLFAYLAPVLNLVFFPENQNSLFYTYTILAIGIFIRPMGSLFSGFIADLYGRKKILLFSILIMSIASIFIAILPGYSSIGIWSPLLLLLFRVIQGISISIEHNNASNYLIEQHSNKIFASSIFSTMGALGIAIASLSVSSLDLQNSPNAWRYLFFISSLGSFIIYFCRKNLPESIEFLKIKRISHPFKYIFEEHLNSLFIAVIFTSFFAVFFYIGNVYFFGFLVKHSNYSLQLAGKISSYNYLFIAVLTIFLAYKNRLIPFSLKYLGHALITIIIVSPILFYIASLGPKYLWLLSLCLLFFSVSHSIFTINLYYLLYKLFPTEIRCSATNFSYSFPIAIFGGTAPLIAEKMIVNDFKNGPGLYISIMALIGLITYKTKIFKRTLNKNES